MGLSCCARLRSASARSRSPATDLAAAAQREAGGVALIKANHLAVVGDAAVTVPREQRIHQPAPHMGAHQVRAGNLPRLDQARALGDLVVEGAV